jgi:hypothetical protein
LKVELQVLGAADRVNATLQPAAVPQPTPVRARAAAPSERAVIERAA